ncbi:hypothetical protein O9H85_14890 [Paenibacillus filicis]|uniref:Prolipoprotein diacylglyceryl transferase n=1 Tax=Paenibacillus gyeongsangnamensis TaxID=3388067 RepID=A0ABT4QA94_9BACL|nr:hypothetical protein [Paenibacillus filicis]MCZ8513696.1 hypothetical protein [Paenibacillus filicis]
MKTLQLGPFLLNTDLIMLILSVLFGYIGLSIRLNGYQTVQTFVKDKFSNALLLWLVIWKFSIIVFDPIPVIKAPLSLIYFNGGEDGMWLAGALSGIYLWSNLRKNLLSVAAMIEFAAITFFCGFSSYQLLMLIGDIHGWQFHVSSAVISMILAGAIFKQKKRDNLSFNLQILLWFSLAQIFSSFLNENRTTVVSGFSETQLIFAMLSLIFLGLISVVDKRRR